MNLRSYVRFFRPVCSLAIILPYAVITAFGTRSHFHLDELTAKFLACAITLPLLLGLIIAGTVHEPMHRPFILLLPDGMRKLRRATAFAILVSACFVTSAAALANPVVPPMASFGLACALLALPCLDRHRSFSGTGGLISLLAGWAGLTYFAGPLIQPAMLAAPWAFCLGGFALMIATLARGFSRAYLHQRAATYFIPPMHSIALIFDRRTSARQNQELQLNRERMVRKATPQIKCAWNVRSVGPSTREWMRVLLHGFPGWQYGGGCVKNPLRSAGIFVLYVFAFPLLKSLFNGLTDKGISAAGFWEFLADLTGPLSLGTDQMRSMTPLLQAGFPMIIAVFIAQPQIPYPISRARLAKTVFGLSLRQLGMALAMPGTIVLLLSLLGQFASGRMQSDYGVRSVLAVDLLLAVGLPLIVCGGVWLPGMGKLLWSAPIAFALIIAVSLRDHWIPSVLTVPGVLFSLIASGSAIGLLWFLLRHHYRTSDLFFESGPFGTSAR